MAEPAVPSSPSDHVLQLEARFKTDVDSLCYMAHKEAQIVVSYRRDNRQWSELRRTAAKLIIGSGLTLGATQLEGGRTNIIVFMVSLALIDDSPIQVAHHQEENYFTVKIVNRSEWKKFLFAFLYHFWDSPPPKDSVDRSRRVASPNDEWWTSWDGVCRGVECYVEKVDGQNNKVFRNIRGVNFDIGGDDYSLLKFVVRDECLGLLTQHFQAVLNRMPIESRGNPLSPALRLLFVNEQSTLFLRRSLADPDPAKKVYRHLLTEDGIRHELDISKKEILFTVTIKAPNHHRLLHDGVSGSSRVILPLYCRSENRQRKMQMTRINVDGRVERMNREECVMSFRMRNCAHNAEQLGTLYVDETRNEPLRTDLVVVNTNVSLTHCISTEPLTINYDWIEGKIEYEPQNTGFGQCTVRIAAPRHYRLLRDGINVSSKLAIIVYEKPPRPEERGLRVKVEIPVTFVRINTDELVVEFTAPRKGAIPVTAAISEEEPDKHYVHLVLRHRLDRMKVVRRVISDMMCGETKIPRAAKDILRVVSDGYRNQSMDPYTAAEIEYAPYRNVKQEISLEQFVQGNFAQSILIGPPESGKMGHLVDVALQRAKGGGQVFMVDSHHRPCRSLSGLVAEVLRRRPDSSPVKVLHLVTEYEAESSPCDEELCCDQHVLKDVFLGDVSDIDVRSLNPADYQPCADSHIIVGSSEAMLQLLRQWKSYNRDTLLCLNDADQMEVGIACAVMAVGYFSEVAICGDPALVGPRNYTGTKLVPQSILDIALRTWPTAILHKQGRSYPHISRIWKYLYNMTIEDAFSCTPDAHVSAVIRAFRYGLAETVPLILCSDDNGGEVLNGLKPELFIPSTSQYNLREVVMVVGLLKKLLQGPNTLLLRKSDVTIVTLYSGQRLVLDAVLRRLFRGGTDNISVVCADASEYQCRPVTIFSPGAAPRPRPRETSDEKETKNQNKKSSCSTTNRFASDKSRLTSALVRATQALMIVMDEQVYREIREAHNGGPWKALFERVKVFC